MLLCQSFSIKSDMSNTRDTGLFTEARRVVLQVACEANNSTFNGSPLGDFVVFFRLFAAAIELFIANHAGPESLVQDFAKPLNERQSLLNSLSSLDSEKCKDNELLGIFRTLVQCGYADPSFQTRSGSFARLVCLSVYSFAIPNDQALVCLTRYVKDTVENGGEIIELGAGGGYWSFLVQQRTSALAGAIKCFDREPPGIERSYEAEAEEGGEEGEEELGLRFRFADVEKGSPDSVLAPNTNKSDMLLLIWPPPFPNTMGFDALSRFKGSTVAYVGDFQDSEPAAEDWEPLTGTREFHSTLRKEWTVAEKVEIPTWLDEIGDALYVFRRS